ncbi:MAG TPA: N-6 DNA methylase, partial [Vicinamibacterales bacterium]
MLHVAAGPLFAALGFAPPSVVIETRDVLAATLTAADGVGRVALIVAPFGESLDRLWRMAVTEGLRRDARWAVVFNGAHVRVVDTVRIYARRYVEFNLRAAAADPMASHALEFLAAAARLTADERVPGSLHSLVVASDHHAAGVCQSLRDGVLAASADLVDAFAAGRRIAADVLHTHFEQALTIVYRVLFLLFAEARALVPLWHPIYRESYSIESLRQTAERAPQASGMWDALRAIGRLAHAGCRAGDLRVTPFNGRLFSPIHTPLADRRDVDDKAARRIVLALSTRAAATRDARETIAYRDLGVEQLGAVYETLLDYRPRVVHSQAAARARTAPAVTLETGSGTRKATGTFYTPEAIANHLVRRTLAPLVRDRAPDAILDLRIVDPAMGSGAFLVAACRYLSAAYEQALIDNGDCHPRDIDERDRVGFRRA